MTSKASIEVGLVAASAPITALTAGIPTGFVSLVVGLVGVWLARQVFVNRENRRLQRRQPLSETLPITGVAMLIAGVLIVDGNYGVSLAAFTGLGVGWSTVVLLDIFGDRIASTLRAALGDSPPHPVGRLDKSGHDGAVLDDDLEMPLELARTLDRASEALEQDGQRRITDQSGPNGDGSTPK